MRFDIRCSHHCIRIESSSCNFSVVVYVFGSFDGGRKVWLLQAVEILHNAVLPNKSATISIDVTGESYHLPAFVDSIGFAMDITGKETERLHSVFDCPNECLEKVAIRVVRRTGEPDDIALSIDRRRRIPKKSPEVAKVRHPAVFPKHRVRRSVSPNSLVADT